MTLFRTELEDYLVSKGFDKSNITITDGANDQATQTAQIDNFITQGVDVMIVNPVNSSSAPTITDKVTSADIPLQLQASIAKQMKKNRRDGRMKASRLHM